MEKKFNKFEIATIKRTAQSVNPMVSRKAKIREQIDELQAEYEQLDAMQAQYEASIKTMTGGYTTEDLVDKIIETTGAMDRNGKPVKITKYVLKYPDTVIPVPAGVPADIIDLTDSVGQPSFMEEDPNPQIS